MKKTALLVLALIAVLSFAVVNDFSSKQTAEIVQPDPKGFAAWYR